MATQQMKLKMKSQKREKPTTPAPVNLIEEANNALVALMQETSQISPSSSSTDVFEDYVDQTPVPAPAKKKQDDEDDGQKPKCPVHHDVNLKPFVGRKDDTIYYRCEHPDCGVFTSQKDIFSFCRGILTFLHPDYLPEPRGKGVIPFCACEEKCSLTVSKSKANFLKPYFSCRGAGDDACKFFQWGNKSLTKKNRKIMEDAAVAMSQIHTSDLGSVEKWMQEQQQRMMGPPSIELLGESW